MDVERGGGAPTRRGWGAVGRAGRGGAAEGGGVAPEGKQVAPKARKVRCDKGVRRGPRKASADVATRMGPVAIIRLVKGYGRELPPLYKEMLRTCGWER